MKSEAKSLKVQPDEAIRPVHGVLTREDLKTLKAPIVRERLGVKVQTFSKDRTRAMLVLYLQHTDVQDRLEEVDPGWTTEVLKEEWMGDSIYVRLRLSVKGVSRENVGEGNGPKAAYSDALKRCAMLFGVGRYLYDSPTVWVDYDESRDRFRQWSVEDYDRALQRGSQGMKQQEAGPEELKEGAQLPPSPSVSRVGPKKQGRPREQLNRVLMNLYRPYLMRFPDTKFVEVLTARYGVGETRLMTVEQMEDLIQFMEDHLRSVA